MRAIVLEHAGPPEVLEIRSIPRPEPHPGWVLIQVKAFGLNRSELFTRQGYSPGVIFPRVLGIECVGVVQAAPGTSLQVGQTVAAVMGAQALQQLVDGVAAGRYQLSLDKVFPFEHIVEAHRYMEENRATGKLVVLVDERPLP